MNKIRSFFNQYLREIIIAIIIILFIFSLIQVFNSYQQGISEEEKNNANNTVQENYTKESESMISGTSIEGNKKDEYGDLITNFYNSCVDRDFEKAYTYISKECKEELYESQEIFADKYGSKFNGDQNYEFQSWASGINDIYLVKIHDGNMLQTGISNAQRYIQDYVTVVKEDGEYKLNVNSFIGNKVKESEVEKNKIKIKVDKVHLYMDNEYCDITITNNSNKTILLDRQEKSNTTHLLDSKNNKLEAMLYENNEDDLIIESGKSKSIQIKFTNSYIEGIKIRTVCFTDVVTDYNKYLHNELGEGDIIEIECDI